MALTVETLQEIVDLTYDLFNVWGDIEIRESYSGRGMYGAEVPAIVAEDLDVMAQIAAAAGYLQGQAEAERETLDWDLRDLPSRTDNMGRGVVIY